MPVGGGGAWPDNEPTHQTTHQHNRPHRYEGRRRDRRAKLQCPWAAAGTGQTTSQRTKPPISTPGPTGMKGAGGAGGPSCGALGRRRDRRA